MHSKSAQRKPANHALNYITRHCSKANDLEAEKRRSGFQKKQLIKNHCPPSLAICIDMEQLVFVPVSVYNKSVSPQSITKQELPK